MRIERKLITPEYAKELMKMANPRNRVLSPRSVKAYTNDMMSGQWDENAFNPIIIDKNHVIQDGHHRLAALIDSGVSVHMYIVTGAEESSTYDINRPRSYSDIIKADYIDGVSEYASGKVISIIRSIGYLCFGSSKVSIGEVKQALEYDGATLNKVYKISRSNGDVMARGSGMAALYCAHKCGVSLDTLAEFCEIANSGIVKEVWQTAPIILRNQYMGAESREQRTLFFKYAQEAIYDFANRVERRKKYTGKTARYDAIFVDCFRKGLLEFDLTKEEK